MDALTQRMPAEAMAPAMPPEQPLAMPVQALDRWDGSTAHCPSRPSRAPVLARLFVFGVGGALTAYGAYEMHAVVSVAGTTWLQWLLLVLFTINFSWIALAFASALLGFFALLRRPTGATLPERLSGRTAVVMPVYNESTARTFAAVEAMRESLEATGYGAAFDYFVLSDSTQADAWIAEERAFLRLRDRLGPEARIYYRHRLKNHHRKAGNIGDFVSRWGGAYDHMLVLDADSLMSGDCIVRLTAAMEADPDAGIVQSLPLIINRNTLFARLQQFAARIYGPVIATGLAVWSGRQSNYWGHNAVIRTAAFAEQCGLPDLKGRPPFGGHVLSHDFVEAALILRGGWAVVMRPELAGSYEESPPSLIDLAVRDRRWCQGNLQHSRIVGARGLKLASRQHFATGIMSYLASPLWAFQLLVGVALVLQTNFIRPEYFSKEVQLFPIWPRFDAERALALFGLTMGILLAPKFFGLLLNLLDGATRRASGGGVRLIVSAMIEIVLSALVAPLQMLIQSGAVLQILLGRDTGWNPQRRDDGSIPFADVVRRHRWHTLLGLATALSAFMIATSLFFWMSPTIVGLILAIPISWWSGKLVLGLALKRLGLLATPEERHRPPIAVRAEELEALNAADALDDADAIAVVLDQPDFMDRHAAMLPLPVSVRRGSPNPEHVMAQAKVLDANTADEAAAWLAPKERFAVLADRALLDLLNRLRPGGPASA